MGKSRGNCRDRPSPCTLRMEADILDKKLRLLVSDDSKLLRKKLRAELEALDCEVIEAENGKEAIMKAL